MLDDIRSEDGQRLDGRRQARKIDSDRPLTDREVPLGQPAERRLSDAVHAWLDGELPEAAVRKGETARDVEFWKQVNHEAERRRHMRTPPHVQARIMEAIPQRVPQVITPWYRREFVLTPGLVLGTMAALMAVTAAVTVAIMRLVR